MATLLVHRQILKSFGKLPVKIQKQISEMIEKFQSDPMDPAIGLHPLKETMLDPKVRGAKLPGGYRAIIIAPEKGDTYVLVHINNHDEAYEWAKRRKFEVHERTGTFQIYSPEETEQQAQEAQQHAHPEPKYRLAQLSEDELFNAGVPKPLIPAVQGIQSDQELEALIDYLPPDCRDVLFGIASGMSVDQALQEMLLASQEEEIAEHSITQASIKPESAGDFSHITEAPNFDLVIIEGEDHLKEVFERSLEEWRVFLHPYQRKLVQWETKGPMNITGAAGTGKTVALLHRAIHLAKGLNSPKDKILLTTFTQNLYLDIEDGLKRLDKKLSQRIEVTNLHALARSICLRTNWKGQIASDEDIEDIWNYVFEKSDIEDLKLNGEEIKDEYAQVIDPNGIDREEEYLTVVRSARKRITRKDRKELWKIFKAFKAQLKKRRKLTPEGSIHEARLAVEKGQVEPYTHVLVDEIQDFSLEALRLIRAISPIDKKTPNPLCTAGDGHQRIYRKKIPLSHAGIDIRGRSRRLKINYRTTEQIRKWSQKILDGIEIDDLDGHATTTIGDHSIVQGPKPDIVSCESEDQELESIVEWIQNLPDSIQHHEICITPYRKKIVSALNQNKIKTKELKPREKDLGSIEPGVRIASMKRIKGLEFKAVILACATSNDPMNNLSEADLFERCERYVASTRARERLMITLKGS